MIRFVSHYMHEPTVTIDSMTNLQYDLRLHGEDAEEFINYFCLEFGVDLTDDYDHNIHFNTTYIEFDILAISLIIILLFYILYKHQLDLFIFPVVFFITFVTSLRIPRKIKTITIKDLTISANNHIWTYDYERTSNAL